MAALLTDYAYGHLDNEGRTTLNAMRSVRILLVERRRVIKTRWPLVEWITTLPSQ